MYRLLQLSDDRPASWFSKSQYFDLLKNKRNFMDRTFNNNIYNPKAAQLISNFEFPKVAKYTYQSNYAIQQFDKTRAEKFLTKLSSFHTRYYNSTTGAQASYFIKDHIDSIIKDHKYKNMVEVEEVKHDNWGQISLIVRFKGYGNSSEIVVLGSHLDSVNDEDPENGRSPGADDDGSGVTILIELIEIFVKTEYQPIKTLEFQFYSAEEVGFLGSQQIAQSYYNQTKEVIGMLQLDMAGYSTNDYTDPELSKFVKLLIKTYTSTSIIDDKCGYACSDHAAFTEVGYRSAFIIEDEFSPVYHSDKDTVDSVNFEYLLEFFKVSLGFAIELSEPNNITMPHSYSIKLSPDLFKASLSCTILLFLLECIVI
ncbi:Zn-dependent exopeptidase [Conidiobolus coronatus NRRL 28638]|uniref:Peptide hydrolase n=1 Tax=Conidiobolus coronatus (strain ATCC 28846 / CBS 209.66 / NRRL 28638) TaxID=796925 RepID=A0A137P0X7_CONC2|nr:Zn-dependent exopeptidase [Conidiobolus coronatus NRRL 28638]|eukprot:KXN68652.1 Zn-dependent exopeptidase [Conidiobolus coronatus NRRL 28638]